MKRCFINNIENGVESTYTPRLLILPLFLSIPLPSAHHQYHLWYLYGMDVSYDPRPHLPWT